MVILTDGGDNGSRFNLDQAVAAAQGADTAVYAVYYSEEEGYRAEYGLNVCKQLAEATGGKSVELDVKVDPEIIGGIVVRLGSRMVDASIKTKLNSIRTRMKEVG